MSNPATDDSSPAEPSGVTLGVTGQRPRWSVSPWGSITPWGDASLPVLHWCVAADDRWHVPASEPTIRQRRVDGTSVVETRVRVPDGDIVQRVWAAPDRGGTVVVEFENESPMPCAIALYGATVVTERPVAAVAVQGIDLPDHTIVMPLGHRATVRVALPSNTPDATGTVAAASLASMPPALGVVRGWTRVVEQASRLVLPDERLVEAVVSARCDLLLEGPVDADVDPVGFLLDAAELVRCGDSADAWLVEIVVPLERLARGRPRRARTGGRRSAENDRATPALTDLPDAVDAALLIARRAGDDRAVADIERLAPRRAAGVSRQPSAPTTTSFADVRRGSSVGRFVRAVERRLADGGRLLSGGLPTTWLGDNFEVHGLPTSASTTVSFAVRWHGERPAVLWEQQGEYPVTLSAPDLDPGWTSDAMSGEKLWAAPVVDKPKRASLDVTSATVPFDPEGRTFS